MTLVVEFSDVAQGSCTLAIDRSSGTALLVDCPAGRDEIPAERLDKEDATAETVIVSHSDLDHLGGVYSFITSRRPSLPACVHYNHDVPLPANPKAKIRMRAALRGLASLEDDGVALCDARAGYDGTIGNVGRWEILAPTKGELTKSYTAGDANAGSAVVRLTDLRNKTRYLIAGDATASRWARLIKDDVRADVFALPHHGAKLEGVGTEPSIAQVLEAVGASHQVISVGTTNGYGHPSRATLLALRARSGTSRITCTQVNSICQGVSPLPLQQAASLGYPADSGAGGRGVSGCPCAGSVQFVGGQWSAPSGAAHAAVVAGLNDPHCRSDRAQRTGAVYGDESSASCGHPSP